MKNGGKILNFVLTGALCNAGATALAFESQDGPYHGIEIRNVFGLRPPPGLEIVHPQQAVVPPPKITLTGITTILGRRIAFLTIAGGKPGAPPEFLMLAEGQCQNGIEVRQIDENARIVKVINHGEAQTLDFDHDGAKPSGPASGPGPIPPISPRSAAAPPLNQEEQVALIEIQRVKFQQEGDPAAKILPTTEMTEMP